MQSTVTVFIGYWDVVHLWAVVRSPAQAHSRRMLCLQHSVTLPTAHASENYLKHTSLIQDLSLVHLSVMHA